MLHRADFRYYSGAQKRSCCKCWCTVSFAHSSKVWPGLYGFFGSIGFALSDKAAADLALAGHPSTSSSHGNGELVARSCRYTFSLLGSGALRHRRCPIRHSATGARTAIWARPRIPRRRPHSRGSMDAHRTAPRSDAVVALAPDIATCQLTLRCSGRSVGHQVVRPRPRYDVLHRAAHCCDLRS
jgi:hypothetical protein